MNRLFALSFVFLFALGAWAGVQERDLYLLIGQSNMAGRGALTPSNRVDCAGVVKFSADGKWVAAAEPIHFDKKTAGAGLSASFAQAMAAARPGREVGLVPCAVGGSPISRWQPEGDLYRKALARLRSALATGGELKGILWHQGEADAKKQESIARYSERLKTLVEALRKDLNLPKVPFVAGELAPSDARRRPDLQWDAISEITRTTMKELPCCGCVSSQGLKTKGDRLHFDTPSLRIFGRRYAEKLLEIEKEVN